MARYPSLFIYVWCFLGAFYETAHPISASLFDTPTARHNIISYSLPRLGLRSDEDCNLSIYHAEFERDMAVIKAMGVNAVHLLCPWATTDLADHTEILKTLVQYNISFIVSLRTDIYQIEQRGGEKAFQDGMYVLADEIAANPDAAKLLKALSIQYNLTGETASYFFQFVNKVKFWMNLLSFDVPLLVPWVNDISLEDKDIETQLTQWNSANFDAWMTHLYTPGEIQNYVNRLGSATILKQVFIVYGWDSYNTLKNKENQTEQAINVQTLYVFISQKITDSNNTVLGSSVYSFADIYHGAEDDKYVYGDPSATCPDVNPWIQTSCGRRTSDPVNSTWGEDAVSVEVMGLFEHYETIYLTRCVKPKLAALAIASLFTGNNSVQINEECITAISNPFIPYSLLAPAGVSVVGVFISLIFCCVRPESTSQKPTSKTESDLLTKLQ